VKLKIKQIMIIILHVESCSDERFETMQCEMLAPATEFLNSIDIFTYRLSENKSSFLK